MNKPNNMIGNVHKERVDDFQRTEIEKLFL